jgi:hypothetical protein
MNGNTLLIIFGSVIVLLLIAIEITLLTKKEKYINVNPSAFPKAGPKDGTVVLAYDDSLKNVHFLIAGACNVASKSNGMFYSMAASELGVSLPPCCNALLVKMSGGTGVSSQSINLDIPTAVSNPTEAKSVFNTLTPILTNAYTAMQNMPPN